MMRLAYVLYRWVRDVFVPAGGLDIRPHHQAILSDDGGEVTSILIAARCRCCGAETLERLTGVPAVGCRGKFALADAQAVADALRADLAAMTARYEASAARNADLARERDAARDRETVAVAGAEQARHELARTTADCDGWKELADAEARRADDLDRRINSAVAILSGRAVSCVIEFRAAAGGRNRGEKR
jgi:hypothetical protein